MGEQITSEEAEYLLRSIIADEQRRLHLLLMPYTVALSEIESRKPPRPVTLPDGRARHHSVTHSAREYARTEGTLRVHTNTIEGFFGLFKIGILGIHHWVSAKHLHRYATEHEFRYNKRGHDVGERIARCLIGQHGRLRLRELFA